MVKIYNRTVAAAMLLISRSAGVLANHNGIVSSISRPGRPCDNANSESFFRTLKREEIHAKDYEDLEDLRLNISAFIECYYNRERLHSALE